MAEGPAVGLAMIDGVATDGGLADYPYLHAARADLLRRLDRRSEAAAAYRRAAELTTNLTEKAFLERRLAAMTEPDRPSSRLA
jgi:RNA polymerase sigma-70 factor (ECF subfamily)